MNEELQAIREMNKTACEIYKWKYQRKSCVNCEYKIICAGECSETIDMNEEAIKMLKNN